MKFLESAVNIRDNQWYKYLGMILITLVAGQLLGGIPLAVVIIMKSVEEGQMNLEEGLDLTALGIENTPMLILVLIPFLLSFLFYVLLFKPIHRRSWITSINGTTKIRWKRVMLGALVWGSLSLVLFCISYALSPDDFIVQFDLSKWIPLLVVSLLFLPIQTGYEELLFRGYLAQGVGSLFRNRLLAIILPSICFALLHGLNPEIEKYGFWIMMPQYFTIGATFAIMSVLDDGIELAIGAHAINNIFSSVILNYDGGALTTDAAFLQKNLNPEGELIGLIIVSAVICVVMGKFLKWDWGKLSTRIEPIPPPIDDEETIP